MLGVSGFPVCLPLRGSAGLSPSPTGLQVAPPSGIQRQYQQLQAAAAYQAHLGLQPQQLQLLQSQLGETEAGERGEAVAETEAGERQRLRLIQ